VQEQTFDAFAPNAPQRTIRDRTFGPAPGSSNRITGTQTTLITNVDVTRMKAGLQLLATSTVQIYDYTFLDWDTGGQSIHGSAIKIGEQPTSGPTFIQRIWADGLEPPDPTYNVSNTDFIGIELDSGPIYVRDVTGRNFGDAGIDSKSAPVYVMNATLERANRLLRAWPNVEIVIVNSIVNAAQGFSQAWLSNSTSTIRYYNVLWCVNADVPSASHASCRTTPTQVEGENISDSQALARMIALASNPLPGISSFFRTQVERIVLQYSTDSGATWQNMSVPNTGSPGSAPVGDPRYRIPLDLNSANFFFRAWYERGGAKIGETSAVINESGAPV
jgi:hypothetical protein